ncbi:hypothetical protein X879_755 [Burkholderia pseudomallei MSHR3951]|nr:hypothetical protein X944_5566 [Burkholderia pseudomallei MSHR3964]KGV87380.1 hypothetical protein X879_755 [Burkholderia pseudomallei MSHR3951]KGW01108.1 hypothetical protein X892_4836 [Burkholderia pseudomallei MSHR3960]
MRLSQPFVRRAGERGERRSAAASAAGSGRRGARGEAPGPGRAAERAGRQRAGAPAWAGKSGRTRGATGGDGRSLDRAVPRGRRDGASEAERVKRAGIAERPRSGGDEAAAPRPNGRRAAPDWAESQRDATDRRGARPCTPLHDAAANGRERNEAKRISARKPRPDASRALATRGGRGRRRKRRLPGGASAGKSRPGARHAANRARPPRSIGDRLPTADGRQRTAGDRPTPERASPRPAGSARIRSAAASATARSAPSRRPRSSS